MRKIITLCIAFIGITSLSMAQFTLTLDWSYADTTSADAVAGHSDGAYNWVTGHLLQCEYNAPAVNILSGMDGTDTGSDLDLSGLTLGTLGVFALTVAKDGTIYGGSNDGSDSDDDLQIITWANEGATPSIQTVACQDTPRQMKVRGTGTDTIIAVTGTFDNGAVSILTTTDGTTFTQTDSVNDNDPVGQDTNLLDIKHGLTINQDGTTIIGVEGYGGDVPVRIDKIGSSWVENTLFDPATNAPAISTPCPIDYMDNYDLVLCVDANVADSNISALDSTGSIVDAISVGLGVNQFGYGSVDADETAGFAYFIGRDFTTASPGQYVCGRVSFPIYVPPSTADPAWALYE